MVESYSNNLNIFIVGRMGMGKSTMGNTLTGTKKLKTSGGAKGCTVDHEHVEGNGFDFYDTPGDGDPQMTKAQWKKVVTDGIGGK